MNDIRRRAEFFAQLGQLRVEIFVLHGPFLPVLRIEDVVLGVVDDLGCVSRAGGLDTGQDTYNHSHQYNPSHQAAMP